MKRKQLVFALIFSFFIFMGFYLIGILKTAQGMKVINIQISYNAVNPFDDISIFRISPKGKEILFTKDYKKQIFYFNDDVYIEKIKIVIPKEKLSFLENISINIGEKHFGVNKEIIKKDGSNKNANIILLLDHKYFQQISYSKISFLKKIINWPGDLKFFLFRILLIISVFIFLFFILEYYLIRKRHILNYLNKRSLFKQKSELIILIFLGTLIFSIIYFQNPLYVSNQHTKFLQGLSSAGYGYLKYDWLANTLDPLPIFSFIVFVTYRFFHEYLFYFYYMILLGVFLFSIFGLLFEFNILKKTKISVFIFFVSFVFLHSVFLDKYSTNLFDFSLSKLVVLDGVAGQYLLGKRMLQPCMFGVFIFLSIFLFFKKKHYLSILFLVLASVFHSAYFYSSAILTLSYMIIIAIEKKYIKSLLLGLFALLLITPILIYTYYVFKPETLETSKQAFDILVNYRIPYHSIPAKWININVFIKIIFITIAIYIVRKTKLFIILICLFIPSVLFTIIQMFVNVDIIGFLAPWRVSVLLVPLSSSIILAYLIKKYLNNKKSLKNYSIKRLIYIFSFILYLTFSYGLVDIIVNKRFYLNNDHGELLNYVKNNSLKNDVFLVPTDFVSFRLDTGVPIVITEKSHPYKDTEVLAWHKRVTDVNNFYNENTDKTTREKILKSMISQYGITHVLITQKDNNYFSIKMNKIFSDNDYNLFKIDI